MSIDLCLFAFRFFILSTRLTLIPPIVDLETAGFAINTDLDLSLFWWNSDCPKAAVPLMLSDLASAFPIGSSIESFGIPW